MANIYDLSDTWNASGTTFTAIKMNVTDTASAAGSLLMDLQVGGSSRFSVRKDGATFIPSGNNYNTSTPNLSFGTTGWGMMATAYGLSIRGANDGYLTIAPNFTISSTSFFGWSSAAGAESIINGADVRLFRDAANTLAQRNGVNAQAFNLYSTYTSATNFQRMSISSARVTLSALTGASATAAALIPDGAVVVGVTARVTTEITGSTGFLIGTAGDTDRWGDITGTAVGTTSDNTNWTAGTIECFTAATDVVITEKTANFTAGAIEIAIHYLRGEAD